MKSLNDLVNDSEDCSREPVKAISTPVLGTLGYNCLVRHQATSIMPRPLSEKQKRNFRKGSWHKTILPGLLIRQKVALNNSCGLLSCGNCTAWEYIPPPKADFLGKEMFFLTQVTFHYRAFHARKQKAIPSPARPRPRPRPEFLRFLRLRSRLLALPALRGRIRD